MIEHMENWAIYGLNAALLTDGVYAERANDAALVADPDPLALGSVIRLTTTNEFAQGLLRYVLAATQTTVGTAQRMYLPFIPINVGQQPIVFDYRDAGNNTLVYGLVTTVGGIDIYNGSNVRIGGTTGPVISANAWYHIETKVFINGAASTCEVRVEGTPVLTLTGLSLGATPIAQLALRAKYVNATGGGGSIVHYKDFVIWNGTGTYNNNFVGSVIVYSLAPDSDVTLGGWTSTAANGWSVLDNAPPVDVSQYISVGTPPLTAAQFEVGALPVNVTTVRALMSQVRAKKIDGGDGSLQVGVVSGASTGLGANRPITAAFTYWRDVFEVDPATTVPWIVSSVNAVKLRLDRTV